MDSVMLEIRHGDKKGREGQYIKTGDTLSCFCAHTPRDIASALYCIQSVFTNQVQKAADEDKPSEYRYEAQERAQKCKTEILETAAAFLLEAHPYYREKVSGWKSDPIKTEFLRNFVAGAIGFYNRDLPDDSKIQKKEVVQLLGEAYQEPFLYCQVEPTVHSAKKPSKTKNTLAEDPCFGDFCMAYRLVEHILNGAEYSDKTGSQHHERLIANLMIARLSASLQKIDMVYCVNPYLRNDAPDYMELFNGLGGFYLDLHSGKAAVISKPKSFASLCEAVWEELVCIAAKKYHVKKCRLCNRYYIYRGNRTHGCCSDICNSNVNYWKTALKRCMDSLSDNSIENNFADIFMGGGREEDRLLDYDKIAGQINKVVHSPIEFDIYFALVVGSFFAKSDGVYLKRKELIAFIQEGKPLYTKLPSFTAFSSKEPPEEVPEEEVWYWARKQIYNDKYMVHRAARLTYSDSDN